MHQIKAPLDALKSIENAVHPRAAFRAPLRTVAFDVGQRTLDRPKPTALLALFRPDLRQIGPHGPEHFQGEALNSFPHRPRIAVKSRHFQRRLLKTLRLRLSVRPEYLEPG